MAARWVNIEFKHRRDLGLQASVEDFVVGSQVPADPETVLHERNLSLYSLNAANGEAIFAEVPEAQALRHAPFIYMAQYEQATRLFALPFPDFLRLAQHLPAIDRFIMIYMTGRSGSTLLCRLFNQLDGVASLSEPDAPLAFVHLQRAQMLPFETMRDLLDASVRFLFRTGDNAMPNICVLKTRAESIQLTDLFQAAYPQAKNIFSYRDAVGFVGSMYRIFIRLGEPERFQLDSARYGLDQMFGLDLDPLLPCLARDAVDVSLVELLTLWWIAGIEHYLAALGRGLPITAIKFEDLTQRTAPATSRLLDLCGLGGRSTEAAITAAFARDSQSGTALEREKADEQHLRLTPEQVETVRAVVARHQLVGQYVTSDLPNTITLS